VDFFFWRQKFLDFLLSPPEHENPEHLLHLSDE
jgi:hypothetical protein